MSLDLYLHPKEVEIPGPDLKETLIEIEARGGWVTRLEVLKRAKYRLTILWNVSDVTKKQGG